MPQKSQGYLEIYHSGGIGLPEIYARRVYDVSSAQTLHIEADTYTCGHCSGVVVMLPSRERARETCTKCNRWICDACAWVRKTYEPGVCRDINAVADMLQSLDPANQIAVELLLKDRQHFMFLRSLYG